MAPVGYEPVADELHAEPERRHVAYPQVVHRDVPWERQRGVEYAPREGHAAAHVTVFHK